MIIHKKRTIKTNIKHFKTICDHYVNYKVSLHCQTIRGTMKVHCMAAEQDRCTNTFSYEKNTNIAGWLESKL